MISSRLIAIDKAWRKSMLPKTCRFAGSLSVRLSETIIRLARFGSTS